MLAVKVGYDGTRFAGSQVQPPGVRTVHAEVASALATLGAPPHPKLRWAGRTDAGVSARANVVVLDPPMAPESLLLALSFTMQDAWAWAYAEVPEGFEPRHASRRWYRYHLRSDLDAAALEGALSEFVGEHDFTAFSRLEPGVDPVRRVHEVRVTRSSEHLLVDVVGESFLWNQVRRMVEAARRVAAGDLPPDAISAALRARQPRDLGCAAPEPLVLMDVVYGGVTFAPADSRVFQRLAEETTRVRDRFEVLRALASP